MPHTMSLLTRNRPGARILIFNQQGHREAMELLEGLSLAIKAQKSMAFDHVIFCPTVPSKTSNIRGMDPRPLPDLNADGFSDSINLSTDSYAVAGLKLQRDFAKRYKELDETPIVKVLPSVEDALVYVRSLNNETTKVHAFITGSVHLIGRALGILEGVDAL